LQQAIQLANRLVREQGVNPAWWVQSAWHLALAREPSAKESQEALDLMKTLANAGTDENWVDVLPKELATLDKGQAKALVKLCLTLFNLNEFVYVD
jgi:hypothetical protein